MLYFDYPATSIRKPNDVYMSLIYNTLNNSVNAGRGGHSYSRQGAIAISDAAEKACELLGIDNPERFVFTQNATHALNLAICGMLEKGDHAVVTSMEHNSVLRPVNGCCEYTMVFGDKNGFVKAADVMSAIKPNTKLVVMTHVSNVCGSIQPVYELGKLLSGTGVAFLVDCAQSAGVLDVDAKRMNADMIAVSGHKGIMSPLGVGGLYVSEKIDLKPVITGGTGTGSESLKQPDFMPDKLTAGTQNTPAIAAFGEACSFILKEGRENIFRHETELADEFISELENMKNVRIYGLKTNRNSTVAFNIGDKHSQEVTEILDRDFGIACRGGWHCAFFAHKTLGTQNTGAVRCGFGYFSTREELKKLVDAVYKISIL